ncbi:MAG: right-handed parallel beta-helix repeat-containing protein [Desulfobacteraceae bacterium]|nr:MAG: right-handed parallel beta-helix repeat-containing protein [Desulfobacteraceae bacterium]
MKEGRAKGEKIMYKKHFYTAVILLSFLAVGIHSAHAQIILSQDGWNVSGIGDWDSDTKTATLTTDVTETITISNPWPTEGSYPNLITLLGGGHTISGTSGFGIDLGGIESEYNASVTIQNLNVTGFDVGINLEWCHYINIENVNITGCDSGMTLNPSGYCDVINNTISDCSLYGIFMSAAGTNTLEGNIISGSDYGVLMQSGSLYNTLKNNTIKDNNVGPLSVGISILSSDDNIIYNNNFINNSDHAAVNYLWNNKFYFNGSGNYWDDYLGQDTNDDGIGDTLLPHLGLDYYPLIAPLPLTPEVMIQILIIDVEKLNAKEGIINSLDAKLQNALDALNAANAGQRQDAINKMQAFINAVLAQSGNQISEDDAALLIAQAEAIIDQL